VAETGGCSVASVSDAQVERPWRVLWGVWALYAAFGLLVASAGALVPLIRDDLDLSRSQMGAILGAWQFAYIGSSIPCGRLIDRVGLRRSLTLCIVVMTTSAVLRTTAGGFWSLLATVALLGTCAPIVSIAAPKAASILFEGPQRRRAVGVYGTAPAIGGAIAAATANGVIAPLVDDSWRTVTLVFAAASAVAGLFWWWASAELAAGSDIATTPAVKVSTLVQLPIVRVVLVVAISAFVFTHGLGQWMVDLLGSEGRSVDAAGYWTSGGSFLGMAATLMIPRWATEQRRVLVLVLVLLAGAAGTVLLLTASDWWLAVPLALSTTARVAVMPIAMLVLMDHPDVGPANMAGAGSLFFTSAQVGGVAGPLLSGVIADSNAGFPGVLVTHAALMVALAGFVAVVLPRVSGGPDRRRP
jgi:MFS transporter, CP family, cyanate transporter